MLASILASYLPASQTAHPPAEGSALPATTQFNLTQFRWKNRPLLIFAVGETPELQKQRDACQRNRDALAERDIVVIEVIGADTGHLYDPTTGRTQRLVEEDVRRLRLDYDVLLGDFAVVLLGKDGTEKRRDRGPVDLQPIFEQIDGKADKQ